MPELPGAIVFKFPKSVRVVSSLVTVFDQYDVNKPVEFLVVEGFVKPEDAFSAGVVLFVAAVLVLVTLVSLALTVASIRPVVDSEGEVLVLPIEVVVDLIVTDDGERVAADEVDEVDEVDVVVGSNETKIVAHMLGYWYNYSSECIKQSIMCVKKNRK